MTKHFYNFILDLRHLHFIEVFLINSRSKKIFNNQIINKKQRLL